jgi:DNA-binding transcriptional ArsR family regulator
MHHLSDPEPQQLITDVDALKVYFDPVRKRIMQELVTSARSVQELAERLHIPSTRLYYHIGLLEKHAFVRLVETISGHGAIEEKRYRATAIQYVISRDLMSPGAPEAPAVLETILATVLDATKADILDSVDAGAVNLLAIAPESDALMIRRGFLRLSPEQASAFSSRLLALLSEFTVAQADSGESYGIAVAFYPSVFTTEDDLD